MRRILAWVALCVFGILLAAASPHQASAQQAQEAPAETPANPEPGRLGAELRGLSEQTVKVLGLSQPHAVLMVAPLSGGPAERAGLRPGDVIVELDGAAVGTLQDFITAIQRLGAGRAITLGILRGNERLAVPATLGRLADGQHAAGPSDVREQRIAAHESLLRLLDPATFAHDWAAVQNNLGLDYAQRSLGDKADNLETAIAAYERALMVFTRDASPLLWADTQDNLGRAYSRRIRGDKADNLETAIVAFERALTAFTRDASPQRWALTQVSLGLAYRSRIRGDKADNVEKAIAAYEQGLTVYTRQDSALAWANTQDSLGRAYAARVRGDKADNLETAIAAYERALTVFTRDASPQQWALTQLGLASAYTSRTRGDKADNRRLARRVRQAARA